MPDEKLSDLTFRTRQLEEHLRASPDYRVKASRWAKALAVVLVLGLVFMFGEGFLYIREPKPVSQVMMGSIDVTSLVVFASAFLFIRTKMNLGRLNERWLTTEERKALDNLRREQAETVSRIGSPTGTR